MFPDDPLPWIPVADASTCDKFLIYKLKNILHLVDMPILVHSEFRTFVMTLKRHDFALEVFADCPPQVLYFCGKDLSFFWHSLQPSVSLWTPSLCCLFMLHSPLTTGWRCVWYFIPMNTYLLSTMSILSEVLFGRVASKFDQNSKCIVLLCRNVFALMLSMRHHEHLPWKQGLTPTFICLPWGAQGNEGTALHKRGLGQQLLIFQRYQ